jgi:hypothetical protein
MSETLQHDPAEDRLPEIEEDAAPVEAAAPEPEAAPEAPEEQPRQVPLAELLKERAARKEAAAETARLREMMETGNRRLEELAALVQRQHQPQAAQAPDLNTDPVGHFQHETSALRKTVEQLQAERQQDAQRQQMAAQEQELVFRYNKAGAEFSQKQSDFPAAYEAFKESVIREAVLQGATEMQAVNHLIETEKRLAMAAFRDGDNPAARIYEIAKTRGYQAAPKADPQARMAAMQRGQAAARSVGGTAPGRAAGDYAGLTLAEYVNMPMAEFAKVPQHVADRLLGKS